MVIVDNGAGLAGRRHGRYTTRSPRPGARPAAIAQRIQGRKRATCASCGDSKRRAPGPGAAGADAARRQRGGHRSPARPRRAGPRRRLPVRLRPGALRNRRPAARAAGGREAHRHHRAPVRSPARPDAGTARALSAAPRVRSPAKRRRLPTGAGAHSALPSRRRLLSGQLRATLRSALGRRRPGRLPASGGGPPGAPRLLLPGRGGCGVRRVAGALSEYSGAGRGDRADQGLPAPRRHRGGRPGPGPRPAPPPQGPRRKPDDRGPAAQRPGPLLRRRLDPGGPAVRTAPLQQRAAPGLHRARPAARRRRPARRPDQRLPRRQHHRRPQEARHADHPGTGTRPPRRLLRQPVLAGRPGPLRQQHPDPHPANRRRPPPLPRRWRHCFRFRSGRGIRGELV